VATQARSTPDTPTAEASLRAAAERAAACRACDLWRCGTQTVFGVGPSTADMMLVGEQPGDQEDRQGQPFVGPAGHLLDRAIETAGLERGSLYLTNAVKHFKWTPRGKRRIHQRPNRSEVLACHPWLEAELELVDPDVVVALGAVAGQALFGSSFRVGAARGRVLDLDRRKVVATMHPSAVVRMERGPEFDRAFAELVDDLRLAAAHLSRS
jgi:DNA polymerase